jgi:stearoyl-CoA desaturase (delta-9 desaturase)
MDSTELARSRRLGTWLRGLPFILTHFALIGLYWTGVSRASLIVCVVLYWVRMFGVTGGYHRYFSHRTFKTGRVFQFLLGFLAESSLQKGVLWWAAHHRHHHKFSDTPEDVHSPVTGTLWHAHVAWLFAPGNDKTKWNAVKDLSKYPELRWLNRYWLFPPLLGSVVLWLLGGVQMFMVGGVLSTVLLWHGTFTVNSLAHVFGRRRYATTDDSRNSALIAFITLGEGWHNNHHHYMLSTRQGFRWWEFDVTYYVLRGLAKLGVVWDLREPPREVVEATIEAGAPAAAPEAAEEPILLPPPVESGAQ